MPDQRRREIDVLLHEERRYEPSEDFRRSAAVGGDAPYADARADREAFWASWAEKLHWFRKWDTVLEWEPPFA